MSEELPEADNRETREKGKKEEVVATRVNWEESGADNRETREKGKKEEVVATRVSWEESARMFPG